MLPNPERLLKPGMLMQVTLRKDARRTLVLPEAALMPQGGAVRQRLRCRRDRGTRSSVGRSPLAAPPGEVEVLQGVQAGDLVVTHGTMRSSRSGGQCAGDRRRFGVTGRTSRRRRPCRRRSRQMILSDVSVTRPVFASVLSLLLIAFGLVAFDRLPLREYPDIDPRWFPSRPYTVVPQPMWSRAASLS